MSVCETQHWILDCGQGHGCALWEGENSEVLYWHCYSDAVVGRKKTPGGERLISDLSQTLTVCYNDVDRSSLAEAWSELTGRSIVVPQTDYAGPRTLCATGTVDELLQASGLALQE